MVCAAATLVCALALAALRLHTYATFPQTLDVLDGMLAASGLFEAIYSRVSGRHFDALTAEAAKQA